MAYADFVTAMMAFFLVMWIVAQSKPVKAAVAKYFSDPYGTSTKPGKSNSLLPNPPAGSLPGAKSPAPVVIKAKAQNGRGTSDPGNQPADDANQRSRSPGRAGLPSLHDDNRAVGTVVDFDDENAELNDKARQQLDELTPELLGKSFKIEVRGHTSGRAPAGARRGAAPGSCRTSAAWPS